MKNIVNTLLLWCLLLSYAPVKAQKAVSLDSQSSLVNWQLKPQVETTDGIETIKYFRQLIRSLLDNRKRERESFSKKPFFKVDNMHMPKADEEFMNKVMRIITDNVGEEDFNVETMSNLLCMSHSSVLRKIKLVFNMSPIELIRTVKLKKAAELIQEGKYLIGDICYMVGISSPSYFSKMFFKQFGISPKDFERQCREKRKQ